MSIDPALVSFDDTARLIEFDIHYRIDSRGSPSEFNK